nr:MAG TPA: hypothetical protein [Caudoviricetes sp.]
MRIMIHGSLEVVTVKSWRLIVLNVGKRCFVPGIYK